MTSDLPRITCSTFVCSVAIFSNVRLTEIGSRAIFGNVILSASEGSQNATRRLEILRRLRGSGRRIPHSSFLIRTSYFIETYVTQSQFLVVRASTAFGRHPGDHLIGIHDVARLAVKAVGEIQKRHAAALIGSRLRLIDIRWTEVKARVAIFRRAARDAHLCVENEKVRG